MKKDLFQYLVLDPILYSIQAHATNNAFCIEGKYYTYQQFGTAIERFRAQYKKQIKSIFTLEIDNDLTTYASIIALWLEGKAYVPLNPLHPKEHNKKIIEEIGDATCISDNNLAYIIFTSGSTGSPKGVTITRENLGHFMDSFWKTGILVDKSDRCLQCFDLTFDVSIQSFLVAITKGACVYTVPYGQVKYLTVASLIHESRITFGAMAPSILTYLRPYFGELDASSLKTCILTAEACHVNLIHEWQQCASNATIYDFYGPTEATIYCTCYQYPKEGDAISSNGIVSIGKPLANVDVVILNDKGAIITTPNEKGELCVSGSQITHGYWNNPEKNACAFSMIEYNGILRRYYHTGDLSYWDISGNLMYVGRIDQQTKIQGFRVELSEIEYHASKYYNNAIRVAAVAFQNNKDLSEIALFIETSNGHANNLQEYLRLHLPSYMIPTKIIFLDNFPLNNNDKVDRKKLKFLI